MRILPYFRQKYRWSKFLMSAEIEIKKLCILNQIATFCLRIGKLLHHFLSNIRAELNFNFVTQSVDTLWLLKGDEHNVKESPLVGRVESKPLELVFYNIIKPFINGFKGGASGRPNLERDVLRRPVLRKVREKVRRLLPRHCFNLQHFCLSNSKNQRQRSPMVVVQYRMP